MRAAIAATPPKGERAVISMTASFGVTTIRADDSVVSLFKRADDALRAAKAAGRNGVTEAPMAPAREAQTGDLRHVIAALSLPCHRPVTIVSSPCHLSVIAQ